MNNTDPDFVNNLYNEYQNSVAQNQQLSQSLAASAFQGQKESNLIELQLETSVMLSNIEHFLRGDYISRDLEGNEVWTKQTNDDLILFNDYGVSSILVILGQYIDKNTFLSYYTEERIFEIMGDLGDHLAKFIYCNYEKMGMTTEFKKSRYPITVLTILHIIESAYRRAIRGSTADKVNSSTIVTQNDSRMPYSQPTQQASRKFNLFKPSTW